MERVATIGVYGWTLDRFLEALREADVRCVIDVRQRRSVRGSEYAWANSQRLQGALRDAGIEYQHRPDLAPTTELRRLQYAEDERVGVGKRSRTELSAEYGRRYSAEILDEVDFPGFVDDLVNGVFSAILCVERDPEACHRSLIAARLAVDHGLSVRHLLPESVPP
jgi:uncharacterized protein (DUF488 family)